jgi:hypothetical protein
MISRSLVGSFVLSVAVTMCVDITAAQVRGTGGGARGGHGGGVIRSGQRARLTRAEHRRSYGGFLFYPGFDYYDDDYESNYEPPEASRNVVRACDKRNGSNCDEAGAVPGPRKARRAMGANVIR